MADAHMTRNQMQVPENILQRLRLTCLDLPEVTEEAAWVGTRWLVAKKNFAHVVRIDSGYPPAYARAAGHAGPACVLTVRSPLPTAEVPRFARPPFFRPPWFANIVGLFLDEATDFQDVAQLIVDSYCFLAPQRLAQLIERA
jgi:hypothetical protein